MSQTRLPLMFTEHPGDCLSLMSYLLSYLSSSSNEEDIFAMKGAATGLSIMLDTLHSATLHAMDRVSDLENKYKEEIAQLKSVVADKNSELVQLKLELNLLDTSEDSTSRLGQ